MNGMKPPRLCADCRQPTGKKYGRYCDAHRWRHRGKPPTYTLTAEREAYLRATYQPSARGVSGHMALVLQVPKWRVNRWAAELGLTSREGRKSLPWTPQEDVFLEQHLTTRHVNWLSTQLGRSITAVLVRAKRLRLSRLPDGYSHEDLALAFGVERSTVRRWVQRGWLRASFQRRCGQPHRVTEAAIVRFIRQHPLAFQLAKVDQVWFLGLVFGDFGAKTERAA